MASWLPSFENLGFSSSLGRNVLVGVSIGLGLGIGIGAGMAASRKMFTAKVQDRNLVVRFTQLTEEIKELRCVMVRLEVTLSESKNKRIVPLKDQPTVRESVQSDEETEEDEYYEMSGEEPSSSSSDIDQLKAVIDEVERLHSNSNTEDKHKIHRLLQECLQGKSGDADGKKTLLYEGIVEAEKAIELDKNSSSAHKWYAIILGSTTDYESLQNQILLGFKYKEHIKQAIELKRDDASNYHLLGRWCFEIAMLSWWQRKAASAFVAEPPTSSIEEALENFLKAEEVEPGFWLSNSYWIGKGNVARISLVFLYYRPSPAEYSGSVFFTSQCYKQNGDVAKATEWLKKAISLPVSSDDDKESQEKAQQLLATL
ncbi:Regulator of microtubule dynamics [Desmophyllum pertusum]|uniref:Regulator of microtubule dynamics protein 1 n=1 Tax=Desmophyllum pertusum TaxID=174260 RepID=A0A9W9ZGY9_9CNID|nr:Regulator of microtubule dynamics [Desmophyllum pertusum]